MDLLKGTLDLLVLESLAGGEPLHGYAVTRSIRQRSAGVLQVDDAALYQALHRLEGRGWLESRWGRSENNRKAKFYLLTDKGREGLAREAEGFRRYASAVFRVIGDVTQDEPAASSAGGTRS